MLNTYAIPNIEDPNGIKYFTQFGTALSLSTVVPLKVQNLNLTLTS